MKLIFKTTTATNLKNLIIQKIESGELKTWSILTRNEERYLKHTSQWGDKGVIALALDTLSPGLGASVLKYSNTQEEIKDFEGYYLGRFCELMFVNFRDKFNIIEQK